MTFTSREVNAAKIKQMEFVRMTEVEGFLHSLKHMGRVSTSPAMYQKMLELDVLPDDVKIEKGEGFVDISTF